MQIMGRSALVATALLAISVSLAACGTAAPAAGGPEAVVRDAIAKVAAKDLDGLRSLACAGQEDLIRNQLSTLGLPAGSDQLLPGVDMQAVLDAVRVDVADLKPGDAAVTGDVALVPLAGTVKVTFDGVKLRPILKTVLEQQGATMTDEQLDALLKTLGAYGQDIPVNQSIRLAREGGDWKVCQQTLEAPASP